MMMVVVVLWLAPSTASMPDPHAANKTTVDSNLMRFSLSSSVACGSR